MAVRQHREIHDVEQTKKMVPLITREITKWSTCPQVGSWCQPTQRNSVGSGHVPHRRTSALYDHFDHSFIILENAQRTFELRRTCVCDNVIQVRQFINNLVTSFFLKLGVVICAPDFFAHDISICLMCVFVEECNTSITTSHRSREGIPSIQKPAPKEIISDSVEL